MLWVLLMKCYVIVVGRKTTKKKTFWALFLIDGWTDKQFPSSVTVISLDTHAVSINTFIGLIHRTRSETKKVFAEKVVGNYIFTPSAHRFVRPFVCRQCWFYRRKTDSDVPLLVLPFLLWSDGHLIVIKHSLYLSCVFWLIVTIYWESTGGNRSMSVVDG